jgi:hypothetical protein
MVGGHQRFKICRSHKRSLCGSSLTRDLPDELESDVSYQAFAALPASAVE